MRIGIDVDNTMTNTFEYLLDLKRKYLPNMEDDYHNWDTDIKDEFLEKHLENIWKNCTLKTGCKEVVEKLRSLGHKVIIISYRQNIYNLNSFEILDEYFKKNGIEVDELYVGITKKGDFCEACLIDLFIDDKLENLDAVSKKGIEVIQFYNPFEKTGNYTIVKNWDEVYRKIEKR